MDEQLRDRLAGVDALLDDLGVEESAWRKQVGAGLEGLAERVAAPDLAATEAAEKFVIPPTANGELAPIIASEEAQGMPPFDSVSEDVPAEPEQQVLDNAVEAETQSEEIEALDSDEQSVEVAQPDVAMDALTDPPPQTEESQPQDEAENVVIQPGEVVAAEASTAEQLDVPELPLETDDDAVYARNVEGVDDSVAIPLERRVVSSIPPAALAQPADKELASTTTQEIDEFDAIELDEDIDVLIDENSVVEALPEEAPVSTTTTPSWPVEDGDLENQETNLFSRMFGKKK